MIINSIGVSYDSEDQSCRNEGLMTKEIDVLSFSTCSIHNLKKVLFDKQLK
jgi:hypothetical protein